MSGLKYDNGKAPLGLIPYESLQGTAQVLAFGAKKYAAHNWRGGFEWSRLIDAAMRHLHAFNAGEDLDLESGLSHADHAACCIAFLQAHIKSGLGTDNRYKPPAVPVVVPVRAVVDDILDESGAPSGIGLERTPYKTLAEWYEAVYGTRPRTDK